MTKPGEHARAGPARADGPGGVLLLVALLAVAGSAGLLLLDPGATTVAPRKGVAVTAGQPGSALGGAGDSYRLPDEARAGRLGQRLGSALVLVPRTVDGRVAGYAISDRTDGAILGEAKLRAGDMLVEVDGSALGPAAAAALGERLASADAVELTFVRNGQIRRRLIDLTR